MGTTDVYASKAEKYARYRWDYAPRAIRTILDVTRITCESAIADIGAGTGILAKHFIGEVKRIFVIEPNLEMRRIAAKALGAYPSCHIVDGRGEATPLPDRSVDLITVAQAIHWFEPGPAKAEFSRILRPGGWLAILRNYGTDDELGEALKEVFIEENGLDTSAVTVRPERKPMDFYYGDDDYLKQTFPFVEQVTWEGFVGAHASASYAPDEKDPLYANFERAAKKVFDRFSSDGLLDTHGETELYLGQLSTTQVR